MQTPKQTKAHAYNMVTRLDFIKAIKDLDPSEEIVKINEADHTLEYSSDIILHRRISQITEEELVRAFFLIKLINNHQYKKEQIELEKPVKVGRTEIRLDVIITNNDEKNSIFMIYELKSSDKYDEEIDEAIPNQLFAPAQILDKNNENIKYLTYYTCYQNNDLEFIERYVTISYDEYDTHEKWIESGEPNLSSIPTDYTLIEKIYYIKGSEKDLRKDVNSKEFERVRKGIHNVLWGGGKYAGNVVFNNLLKLFITKIYDEKETIEGEKYKFQIYQEYGQIETPKSVKERIEPLYRDAIKKYLHIEDEELEKSFIDIDDARIRYTVQQFEEISFVENKYGLLGDFFERIIRNEFKQSKGQFFTHNNIIKFINRVLSIEELSAKLVNEENRLPYIIDPACGSGRFLTDAMDLITNSIKINKKGLRNTGAVDEFINTWFPETRINFWATRYVYGIENNIDLAIATKVNMIGHFDGSGNIENNDALNKFGEFTSSLLQISKEDEIYEKPVNEQFDIVITNPPFRIPIDAYTARRLPDSFVWGERIKKKLNSKGDKEKEVDIETLFIERWYQLLKVGGRLGVVLPDSIFNSITQLEARLFLYKYFNIKAVVSLPYLTFQPFTATKTSLLFAQKKSKEDILKYGQIWDENEKIFENNISIYKRHVKKLKIEEYIKKSTVEAQIKSLIKDIFSETVEDLTIDSVLHYFSKFNEIQKEQWVLEKITQTIDYDIKFAHVEEIGYKRSTYRGELTRPNYLYTEDEGEIVIDQENPESVLDFLRRDLIWN